MRINRFNSLFCAIALASGAQTGCADSAATAVMGTIEADSIAGDAKLPNGDAAQATDSQADVQQSNDVQAELPPQDVQPDVLLVDVQPDVQPDIAPPDVQPDVKPDVPPPDVQPDIATDPCKDKLAQYSALHGKALQCGTPFDCYGPGPASIDCPNCSLFYNGKTMDLQNLIDYTPVLTAAKCNGVCSGACADMTKQVGVCTTGSCETKELSCKELDQAASLALAEGAKCSKDSDCTFKVSNMLGCGCPTFVNMTSMGPGKPLFLYMKMLVLAYKAKVCTADITCACPDPNSAKCVAGVCIGQ